MSFFSNSFVFGSRSNRFNQPSHDKDGRPDDHAGAALLAGEDEDGGAESPPPYRSSHHRHAIGFAAGLMTSTLLFALIAVCFLWHMKTLDAPNHELQGPESSKASEEGTVVIPDPEALESDMDPELFAGWQDCGSNVQEARAKGCFFDVMLHSWLPEDCFDQALMDDYLTRVPYHWYRDAAFKDEISVEEMRRGEHGSAAVKLEEHGTHCAYVLEKNLRAIMKGKAVARSIYSVKHAVHCLGLLVDPKTIPGIYTEVVVEYDQCGIPHFE